MRSLKLSRLTLVLAIASLAFAGVAQGGGNVLYATLVLNGASETPPNGSTGTGTADIVLDTNANTLTYHVVFSGLSSGEIASHIHGFAPPGVAVGVKQAIPAGSPSNGVWNYLEADEQNILNGLTYVNIHTSNFPGGEIRGQINTFQSSEPTPATSTWGVVALFASLGLAGAFFVVRRRRTVA